MTAVVKPRAEQRLTGPGHHVADTGWDLLAASRAAVGLRSPTDASHSPFTIGGVFVPHAPERAIQVEG